MGNYRPDNLPTAASNTVALTDFNNAMTELKNMLFSGILKNLDVKVNTTNPTYQIDVDADALGVEDHILKSINLTLDITASGANGLDVGSEAANTIYFIWVIYNPTTDTIAGLLSVSNSAPTMPSGYTKKRLLWMVMNDASSNFEAFCFQPGSTHTPAIRDKDGDSYETVEKTADVDEAVTYLKNVLVRKIHDDGIIDFPKQSICKAYRSGAQSIPNNTYTKIQLNATEIDTQNEFDDTTNYRWTAKKAGTYLITVQVRFVAGTTNAVALGISKNTNIVHYAETNQNSSGFNGVITNTILVLAAGDYIEVKALQNSGGALHIEGDRADTQLSIIKIA